MIYGPRLYNKDYGFCYQAKAIFAAILLALDAFSDNRHCEAACLIRI